MVLPTSSEYVQKAFDQAKEIMPLSLEHLKTVNSLSPEEYTELNSLVEKEPLFTLIHEETIKAKLIHPNIQRTSQPQPQDFDLLFNGITSKLKKEILGYNPFQDKERMRKIGLEILTDPALKDFSFTKDPMITMKIIAVKAFVSAFKDEKIVSKLIESVLESDMARKTIIEENRKESFKDLE